MTNESNVISMGDFLVRRFHKLDEAATRMAALAEDLSKQDKDKFAAPVRGKAEKLKGEAEAVKKHIKFIARGGRGLHIPSEGYTLNNVPPAVTLRVTMDAPNRDE